MEPGRVGLLLCPVIWGASFIVAKVALKTTTPMYLTLLRMMIASATFLPIMLWYTARGVRLKVSHLPMVVWLGFLGFAGYFWIQYTAVRLTSPGSVALIITLSPVWTALIASLVYRERVGLRKLCGIGVAFAGALLVSVGPLLNGSAGVTGADANHLLGAGLALVNTVGWAVYTTMGRRVVASYPPVFITSWIAIAGTALTVLLTFVTGDIYRPLPSDPSVWFAALFLGVLCSTVAYSAWYPPIGASHPPSIRLHLWSVWSCCTGIVRNGQGGGTAIWIRQRHLAGRLHRRTGVPTACGLTRAGS